MNQGNNGEVDVGTKTRTLQRCSVVLRPWKSNQSVS